ncbi:Mu transposase C-terminal domain-containing protein [Cytobacillus dafuensis]|nr:Mu transposase C-terminal domain-containing protein [Cytobacillus dafuensis]
MSFLRLVVGDEFEWYGVKYAVFAVEPPNIRIQRLDGIMVVTDIGYIDLITSPSFNPLKVLRNKIIKQEDGTETTLRSVVDNLTDKQKEVIQKRFEMIKPVLLLEKIKQGDLKSVAVFNEYYSDLLIEGECITTLTKEKLLEAIKAKYKKSVRQLKRYLSSYLKEELNSPKNGLEGLVPDGYKTDVIRNDETVIQICHPHNKNLVLDTIKIRLNGEYGNLIKNVIENYYLKKRRPNISSTHQQLEILCYKNGLKPIPYETLYHIITHRLSVKVMERMRLGKIAEQKYDPITRGFTNEIAIAPLHIVEIDHTPLDIKLIDERTGQLLDRCYITLGIDLKTRMIWCLHVAFEPPSANKVQKAILHGILTKKTKKRYNTLNEWDMFGIPSIFYLDNGKEFFNSHVRTIIEEYLGAQVMHRPRETPNYGGTIERVFGTINAQLIHNLAGTTKSNVHELGDYDASKEAIFTLKDIEELLTVYITDVYHHKPHSELPLEFPTPTLMYYQGIEITGYPEIIEEQDEEEFAVKLLPKVIRTFSRDGIQFGNVLYNSSFASKYIGKQKKYTIKHNDDDISSIYLLDPDTSEYVSIPAQNPKYEDLKGMNRYLYNDLLKTLRETGKMNIKAIPGSRDLVKGIALLKERYEAKMKNNSSMKRKAIRAGFTLVTNQELEQLTVNKPTIKSSTDLEDLINEFNQELLEGK